tara:strand:+ start:2888 stop:3211 length:324 start_codon:yes stop_codon:yes gene_type:complete
MSGKLLRKYSNILEADADSMQDSEKLEILIKGLLKLRKELQSGSYEMGLVDEIFSAIGMSPWKDSESSDSESYLGQILDQDMISYLGLTPGSPEWDKVTASRKKKYG